MWIRCCRVGEEGLELGSGGVVEVFGGGEMGGDADRGGVGSLVAGVDRMMAVRISPCFFTVFF